MSKKVLITGGNKGIGLAVSRAMLEFGYEIIIVARNFDTCPLVGVANVTCIEYDLSNVDGLCELAKEVGDVDILINNAGITNDKLLLRMTEEDFEQVLKINLTGTFNMTQQVLKKMLKLREGVIINLSSVSGLMGNAGQANYAASKAGVVGFTKSVAREVAPRGITCNAIAPGFIQTDMTDVLSDKVKEQMTQNIPLQRFGNVEDVAKAAIFLAKSPYITGQVLNVDGGLVMHG